MNARKLLLLSVSLCLITINSTFGIQPPGLHNFSNTCYLNASVQVLYNCSNLTDYLIAHDLEYPEESFANAYVNLIKEMRNSHKLNDEEMKPLSIFVEQAYIIMGGCGQQDAPEFFGLLLDRLINETPNYQGITDLKHPIGKQLRIDLNSTTTCPAIQFNSTKKEVENKLELSVVTKDGKLFKTLNECLKNYIIQEQLDEFAPEGYEKRKDCFKQLRINNLSDYIILTLKRYRFDTAGYKTALDLFKAKTTKIYPNPNNFRKKITDPIIIPAQLDFSPYMVPTASRDKSTNYELIGAIHHKEGAKGGAESGHYIAYVKNDNQWYLCNDSNIQLTSWAAIQNNINLSYVAIYQRQKKGTPTPVEPTDENKNDAENQATRVQKAQEEALKLQQAAEQKTKTEALKRQQLAAQKAKEEALKRQQEEVLKRKEEARLQAAAQTHNDSLRQALVKLQVALDGLLAELIK